MSHHPAEDYNQFQMPPETLLCNMQTSFVARLVLKDMCDAPLEEDAQTVFASRLTGNHTTGIQAATVRTDDLHETISVTALLDGIDTADALRTLTGGVVESFKAIEWDPTDIELKGAHIVPEAVLADILGPVADLTGSPCIEDFPIDTVAALNPSGDVVVEMEVGDLYYMTRSQFLQ